MTRVVTEAEFRERRALRCDDSHKWTPKDALQSAIDGLGGDAPVVQLTVIAMRRDPEGRASTHYWCSGVSTLEYAAMLALAHQKEIDRLRGG